MQLKPVVGSQPGIFSGFFHGLVRSPFVRGNCQAPISFGHFLQSLRQTGQKPVLLYVVFCFVRFIIVLLCHHPRCRGWSAGRPDGDKFYHGD